jgi:hypothetical protein
MPMMVKLPPGPPVLGDGNFQAHPVRVVGHPLGPIEVHIALAFLLEEEAFVRGANLEIRRQLAFGHGVRLLVQVGAIAWGRSRFPSRSGSRMPIRV